MPDRVTEQITADEVAQRLDRGESLQVLDVRAPDRVARNRVAFGTELQFHALPNSKILALLDARDLQLDAARPVAVI